MKKVAFTGASGTGKTTLVKYVEEEFKLKHISGSAGDIKTDWDKNFLRDIFNAKEGEGHLSVIKRSAIDPFYGIANQQINLMRRNQIIMDNHDFVTDRSPLDNLVYCINQIGFHKEVSDTFIMAFADKCLKTWKELTHVIYIRAGFEEVEDNGSRIFNSWYQRSSDAQFEYWMHNWFMLQTRKTRILLIDFWDLEERKKAISLFLNET